MAYIMPGGNMENKHDFKRLHSVQWGSLGLPWESARSDYKCKKCGVGFSHYYHTEPNIYKAMKNEGIDAEKCEQKE